MGKNKEYKGLDLPHLGKEILSYWNENSVFKTIRTKNGQKNSGRLFTILDRTEAS